MPRNKGTDHKLGIVLSLLLCLLASAGCTPKSLHYPLHPSLQTSQLPPLLSIEELFHSDEEKFRFRVSPDGRKLAWVETVRGTTTVHYKTIGKDDTRHLPVKYGHIYGFTWAQDNQRILVNYRSRGKENNQIYAFNLDAIGRRPFKLYEFRGFMSDKKRALIHRLLPNDPDHILIENNDRDLSCYDLYKVNIHAKDRELLATNPGDVRQWITDRNGTPRARIRVDDAKHLKVLDFRGSNDDEWREKIAMGFEEVFEVVGFDDPTGNMWVLSNRNRDKVVLAKLNLRTFQETVLLENREVDVDACEVIRKTGVPYLAYTCPDYPQIAFLDTQTEKTFKPLLERIETDGYKSYRITSADNQAHVFTVYAYSDKDWSYYLFNRLTADMALLSRNPLHKRRSEFASIEPITFTSRDGIDIKGYLTLPRGGQARDLPLVVLVHGGPWSRDYWGYNRGVQLYANRGYAVLQINFRGSDGYGKHFMELAVGEFAGSMQNDLLDGALWAIQEGIADPGKIAICGQSYGGYAALVGLTFTPDFFACGINVFGPSDLETLLEYAPVWWKLGMAKFYKYIGNPGDPDDRAAMRAKSPLYRLDDLSKPLLIVYGSEDQRVAKKQSKDIIERLKELEKPFEWYAFPDAGHGIYGRNRITYYRLVQEFLAKNLGGRNS